MASAKITPGKAVRRFCIECAGGAKYIENCSGIHLPLGYGNPKKDNQCWFYLYRMGKGRPGVRLIRKMCKECCSGSNQMIAECDDTECPLHSFRFGKNPNYRFRPAKNFRKKVG